MATRGKVTAEVTTDEAGTDFLKIGKSTANIVVDFINGSFVGAVTLQRRFIDNKIVSSTFDVKTYTASIHEILTESEDSSEFRLYVKSGDYSSGEAELRISF